MIPKMNMHVLVVIQQEYISAVSNQSRFLISNWFCVKEQKPCNITCNVKQNIVSSEIISSETYKSVLDWQLFWRAEREWFGQKKAIDQFSFQVLMKSHFSSGNIYCFTFLHETFNLKAYSGKESSDT